MAKLVFYIDVSPKWWIRARKDKEFLKSYVSERFETDFYPRTIQNRRNEIDLDKSIRIKKEVIMKVKHFDYDYEFLPEDEKLKESYSISNGYIHFHPRKNKTNSRLLIKISDISQDI